MKTVQFKVTSGVMLAMLPILLVGCGSPDRRLVLDQQNCTDMGHVAGTPMFRKCLDELNDRRCARGSTKTGSSHVVTSDCTRLN